MLTGDGAAGFTLVEMILVLVILGILLAVAVPKFINLMDQTVDTNRCASSEGRSILLLPSRIVRS